MRTVNVVEKNALVDAPVITVIAAAGAAEVLPVISGVRGEWSGRYIQNVGANPCYYAFGVNASPTEYHGILSALQQLDCSNHGMLVSCYSVLGTSIAITVIRRYDNATRQNVLGV